MRLLMLVGVLWMGAVGLASGDDWPQWRGPTGNNHAPESESLPRLEWSTQEGYLWKVDVPGRGHSSPIIVGDRLYLTTCDEQAKTMSLLVFDRTTGKLLSSALAHTGGLPAKTHPHNTYASPTPASDGERVYALFDYEKGAWLTAYDLQGNRLWQRRVAGYDPQMFQFGFGSSPIVYDNLVIVAAETDGDDSGLYALDKVNGEPVWKRARRKSQSYSTPIAAQVGERPQLLISGQAAIVSYDPATGGELWRTGGAPQATCGTMVWDQSLDLVFASGGFPESTTMAVEAKGEHKVVWRNRVKCYEQSLLVAGGYVYAVADSGVAYCWRASDGEQMWRERLGGKYSSSPLLVGDRIYVSNEAGTTFVFSASAEKYEPLAEIQLGNEVFATPACVDGTLYYRYADSTSGERKEYLIAVGE